jgi:hypothetical protein
VSPISGESFTLFLPEVNTDMMNIFFEELVKEYPGTRNPYCYGSGRVAQGKRSYPS